MSIITHIRARIDQEPINDYAPLQLRNDALQSIIQLPAVQLVKYQSLRTIRETAMSRSKRLITFGWCFLVVNLIVSFAHAWQLISGIAPASVPNAQLSNELYYAVSALQIVLIDTTVVFLAFTHNILKIVNIAFKSWHANVMLALVFILNCAYYATYSGVFFNAFIPQLTNELIVILAPLMIVLIYISVKASIGQLELAQLRLGQEIESLRVCEREMENRI